MHIVWFILAGIFLAIELITTALVSVWFIPGALVAGIVALLTDNLALQIVAFCLVSVIAFPISRKIYTKYIKKNTKTEDEKLLGKTGIVEETVTEINGRVKIDGVFWPALIEKGTEEIKSGEIVQVIRVDGLKLIVKPIKQKDIQSDS